MDDFLISHGSYLLIVAVLIMTGAGLPLPEEIPIIAAGVLAGRGQLDPWLGLAACIFGALTGDCAMYWIGRRFGRGLLASRHWFARFVTPQREAQVEQLFRRHGLKMFFTARFLVVLRSPLLLAAGIMRLPFGRFLLIDLVSAVVVVGSFYGLAYFFGRTVYDWIRTSEWALTIVALGAGAMAGAVWWWRRRGPRVHQTNSPERVNGNQITGEPLSAAAAVCPADCCEADCAQEAASLPGAACGGSGDAARE